jgi:hypothetical protein
MTSLGAGRRAGGGGSGQIMGLLVLLVAVLALGALRSTHSVGFRALAGASAPVVRALAVDAAQQQPTPRGERGAGA